MRATAEARRQLEKESAAIARGAPEAEATVRYAEDALAQWRADWAAAIAPLGLPGDSSPAVVNAVLAQSIELFSKLSEAEGYDERIEGIGRDAQSFRCRAEQVLAAVDAGHSPPADRSQEAVEDLATRLRRAIADRKELDLLRSQHKKLDEKRRQAHELAESLTAKLAVLCKEARCETVEQLPAAEAAAAESQRLRRERDAYHSELLQHAAGAALDELIAEATSIAADSLPVELPRIAASIAELEARRDEQKDVKFGAKAVLAGMDGSAAAAEAAEDVQEIVAQLDFNVRHYVRLRLASAVLREGIERYRKKNEGPVLARAGDLFRRLTVGSFESLRIGFDENGDQVLEGVRPDGKTLPPAAMSEGACDQLYLALRLASLENWLGRNEPLPLIVDDILVSFDNARAAATLEVLAELSRRTQVIFFTHHEHLIELARRCVPADALYEHPL